MRQQMNIQIMRTKDTHQEEIKEVLNPIIKWKYTINVLKDQRLWRCGVNVFYKPSRSVQARRAAFLPRRRIYHLCLRFDDKPLRQRYGSSPPKLNNMKVNPDPGIQLYPHYLSNQREATGRPERWVFIYFFHCTSISHCHGRYIIILFLSLSLSFSLSLFHEISFWLSRQTE